MRLSAVRSTPRPWLVILTLLALVVPVLAAHLATISQTSAPRQVTDPVYPLPPIQDGSIVVTIASDRPISLLIPDSEFSRVDANTFTTRFPWNWTTARTVIFVDDLNEQTAVEVSPALNQPYTPLNHGVPVISITTDRASLWDPETGIYTTGNYTNFLEHGGDWEHPARFEYFEPGAGRVVDQPIGLRIHGGYSRNYHQKGLRFYFDDYGTTDIYEHTFFPDGPTEFERLIIRPSRYDDNCLNTNFAEGLFGDLGHLVSRYRFVALYLNEEYWGAYSLRERLDDEFIETTWHLGFGGLNLIKDGETKKGDASDWWDFLASFANVADPEDPAWFASVQENLDLTSYIDWQLINMYGVAGDNGFAWNLVLYQTGAQPWRLIMWDEDLLLREVQLNTDMFRFLTARNETEWNLYRAPTDGRTWNAVDQEWLTMFRTLLGNSEFRGLFRGRLEHLMAGPMSADQLASRIETLAVEQRPEIPGHAARWQGFQTDWYKTNVARSKQWLIDRRPLFLNQADAFFTDFEMPARADDFAGLVINEFLASNDTDAQDETGDHADWVEIYNRGNTTVNLTGMFLTDDLADTQQWEFPAVLLPAGERLIVWCDKDPKQGPLHATFKLSASGEELGLFAPTIFGNLAVDTYVFGPQTTDVSEGRQTDGDSQWVLFDTPTFGLPNGETGPVEVHSIVALGRSYPNPFNFDTTLDYLLPTAGRVTIRVFDVRGQLIQVLVDEDRLAGEFQAKWQGQNESGRRVPSGVYYARMTFGNEVHTRAMTLVR